MKKNYLFIISIIAVIFFKLLSYYYMMEVESGKWFSAAFSTLVILWLFFLFIKLNNRFSMLLFITVYSVISLLMLVDTVYFKQFNMMTSVNLLKMMGKLGDVTESIKQIVDVRFFIFALDIPIMICLIKQIHKRNIYKIKVNNLAFIIVSIFIFFTVFIHTNFIFAENLKKVEFFNYHINDIYKNVIHKEKSKYYTADALKNPLAVVDKSADKLHGIAKGRNLIVIQIESYQNFIINRKYNGQEITPFLNNLIKSNSLYFNNYHDQVGFGNTVDAEFISNNSLFGTLNGPTYELYTQNIFNGLPWILRENGYTTFAIHGYKGNFDNRIKAYPYQGFQKFISQEDMQPGECIGMGLSDEEVYKQTINFVKQQKQPFYGLYVTLTNHHPYKMPSKYQKIKLKPEHEGTLFGNYMEAANYTDQALKTYFELLKENGLYDNSIIAIYGDHHAFVISDKESSKLMTEFLGKPYDIKEMNNIPLIIHVPGIGHSETSDIPSGQVDFAPTILNLLGIQNTNPYMYGQDLVNAKEDGFVPLMMYTGKGSFITKDIVFEMPMNDRFDNARAWNPQTGAPVDTKSCEVLYKKALRLFDKSDHIIFYNMIEKK